MSEHAELIERLRLLADDLDDENRPTSSSVADAAADALEAQAREIEAMQQQESELCTLYAMAEAECKKLRAEIEGLQAELARARTSAELIREGLQTMREVES